MNRSLREQVSTAFAAITGGLIGLVREMVPIVLFFFITFGLIFLLFKLFVSQYSIEFSAFSKAAVAALILAKVILLVDWAESGLRLASHRRAVVVVCQTFIYALAVIILGIGEKIFHSVRAAGNLEDGISAVIANANVDRFLGLVLLLSLIVGSYLSLEEISRAMGKGALFRLFFEPPLDNSKPRSPLR